MITQLQVIIIIIIIIIVVSCHRPIIIIIQSMIFTHFCSNIVCLRRREKYDVKRLLDILYLSLHVNINKAWAEIIKSCLNSVWKKRCPRHVIGFEGLEKMNHNKEVTDEIVKLAALLYLEADAKDVEECIA